MKASLAKNLYLLTFLIILSSLFIGHSQTNISMVTTTPAAPIPRNAAFTVTVNISGAPVSGNKRYNITVNCADCTPSMQTFSGPDGLTIANNATTGALTTATFTSPNRGGVLALSVTATGQNAGDGCITPSCTAGISPQLPVELISFEATKREQKIALTWSTTSELNNEKFLIETSNEGEIFSSIGEVQGAGTTTEAKTYQFTHHTPSAGVNYYRLKQLDFDGTFAYSKVVAVNAPGSNDIFAFPNPTKDKLYVQYDRSKGAGNVYLYDALGRRVNAGISGTAGTYEVNLPGDSPKGTYWLKVERAGKVQTVPVIKE